MTTNVGAIKYTVEAETGDLLTAEKVVDKTTDSMAKDFKKVDDAAKKTSNEVKKSAKAVDMALQSEAKASERAAKTAERAAERKVKASEKSAERSARASEKAAASEKSAAQRSERATTAAAKKAADEKIAAANRSAKATAAANNRAAVAEQKRISGFGRSSGQAGIQIQQFVGQIQGGQNAMLALSAQSADLGFVLGAPLVGAVVGISASLIGMLIPSLFDSGQAVDELIEKMEEWKKTIGLSQEQIDFLTNKEIEANVVRAKSISEYTKEIEIIKQQIANQDVLLNKKDLDVKVRKTLTKAQQESNKELAEQTALLQAETQAIVDSGKKIDGYNASLNQGTEEIEKQKEATKSFKATLESQLVSLEQQAMALENGEEAAFRWASAQRLGMKEGELFEESVDQRITALFKLKAAQDATAKDESDKKRLTSQVQGLGVSPEDQIRMRLDKELELLRLAQEQKIEIEGTYQERRIELQSQADEKIAGLNKKTAEESILNYEALENQIIGTFASIATGAQDGKEAIRSLAQSILTQMIGSLIKMGIQALIGQTTVAAGTAASMGAIAVAAAPAAALVSLATSGANAPLATAGMATVGAAATAMSLPGRQFGGGVSGGNAYRMGEDGPEILQQGNKNIVIPGENGKVISNKDLGGGGGTTININNMAAGVDVQATPSNDGKTIDIAVRRAVAEITNQVATGNGRFMNALKSNTNMTSKATR
mgnify:CR=1 FL=1